MTRIFILLFSMGMLLSSCQQEASSTGDENTAASTDTDTTTASKLNKNLKDAPQTYGPIYDRLLAGKTDNAELKEIGKTVVKTTASEFLESIDFQEGKLTLKYFDNAAQLNKNNEGKRPYTEESFEAFWALGSRSDKVICSVPASLLRDISYVKSVKATLPTGERVLITDITREDLMELSGKSWEDLKGEWNDNYANMFVRVPEGREKYIQTLVFQ